ncbi:helix-turn-helix domain-containing protein [Lactococcus sp. S64]|uniref:helix-turn-helix domain-containing protein n=1 Tax=Lactococcus sp. S64 TaxID=2767459 RepID=UPI001906DB8A|nr:helix-turn-helix domain-containing protein [Lactococcus sp. S64]MBK0084416.1 helix-turn-helix domain-containing protein [Lactococcus sp. S64]
MKTNYFKALFSKETVQQLYILELLYEHEEGMTAEDFKKHLSLERRNLYKIIDNIKETSDREENSGKILFLKGLYYFIGDKIMYFRLRSRLMEEEPMLILANLFLTKNEISLSYFCKSVYISESTFKRYLQRTNRLVHTFGIRIRIIKSNIVLFGKETVIRYCLSSFLWRVYNGVYWPFSSLEKEKVYNTASMILYSEKGIAYGKQQQTAYALAVHIIRATAKHKVSEKELPDYYEELIDANSYFAEFSNMIETDYQLEKIEVKYMFLRLYTIAETYNYFDAAEKTMDVLEKHAKESYKSVKDFLYFVKQKHPEFHISKIKYRSFLNMILAGRIFVDIFGDAYFNSANVTPYYYAERDYPHLLPTIQKIVQKSNSTHTLATIKALTLRYGQAYTMEFSPLDFEPQILILLDTATPMYIDEMVRERVYDVLHTRFNFSWTDYNSARPDLLIASGKVGEKYSDVPTVYINIEVIRKDENALIEACEKIVFQKNAY